eukprot:553521_1
MICVCNLLHDITSMIYLIEPTKCTKNPIIINKIFRKSKSTMRNSSLLIIIFCYTASGLIHEAENGVYTGSLKDRSGASGLRTVHLDQGEFISWSFNAADGCFQQLVNNLTIVYSNDGPSDTLFLYLDEQYIGQITTHSISNYGQQWNIMYSSFLFGPFLLSSVPSHTLKIVAQNTDQFGVEIDRITTSLSIPIAPVGRCYTSINGVTKLDIFKQATYSDYFVINDHSASTQCAEEESVWIDITSNEEYNNLIQVNSIDIYATYPIYFEDNPINYRNADFTSCQTSSSQGATVETVSRIFDNGLLVIESVHVNTWWLNEYMKISVNGAIVATNAAYWRVTQKLDDISSYQQTFVMYQDGNIRLLPHPPGCYNDWIPFGSSIIIGNTVSDIQANRPYNSISSVTIQTFTDYKHLTANIVFKSGDSMTLSLNVGKNVTHISATNVLFSDPSASWVTIRSMFVANDNNDIDTVRINQQTMYPILANPGFNRVKASFFEFGRKCISKHNTLSPDISFILTGYIAPTSNPTTSPTENPTFSPTVIPTFAPTLNPTTSPFAEPTNFPSLNPTNTPTAEPSQSPSAAPTQIPTFTPSFNPTTFPTLTPTIIPTFSPSDSPSLPPTNFPSSSPSINPTLTPTIIPSSSPSGSPSQPPSAHPTQSPTSPPTNNPTSPPTINPSISPSFNPSNSPTQGPSITPTTSPTLPPTHNPTSPPTINPSISPSFNPTNSPTQKPSAAPTISPTISPSGSPSQPPSIAPTMSPTFTPTNSPTSTPTIAPTIIPTQSPSLFPTLNPTSSPTKTPSAHTATPTSSPTTTPTFSPTQHPTYATFDPTWQPTLAPTPSYWPKLTSGYNLFKDDITRFSIIDDKRYFENFNKYIPEIPECSYSEVEFKSLSDSYYYYIDSIGTWIGAQFGISKVASIGAGVSASWTMKTEQKLSYATHFFTMNLVCIVSKASIKGYKDLYWSDSFVHDFLKLPKQFNENSNITVYQDFWNKYGTHIVLSANFGGSIHGVMTVEKCSAYESYKTMDKFTICLNEEYKGVEAEQCVGITDDSGSIITASQLITAKNIKIKGCDMNEYGSIFSNFGPKKLNFDKWIESCDGIDSLVIVGGEIETIHEAITKTLSLDNHHLNIFNTSDAMFIKIAEAMKDAYKKYSKELTDTRIECDFSCHTGEMEDECVCIQCDVDDLCCGFEALIKKPKEHDNSGIIIGVVVAIIVVILIIGIIIWLVKESEKAPSEKQSYQTIKNSQNSTIEMQDH